MAKNKPQQSKALSQKIQQLLEDNKAKDITVIDLDGKSSIADFMIIASGSSGRQISALANKLQDIIKPEIKSPFRVEGADESDWVLIDCGDVIVHLFRPEVRDFYDIEKIWQATESSASEKITMSSE